ncbi:Uncharacterised protein [Exiguobacterium aurantiacum]|uniref:T786P28D n=1 Tax=Exiguobacterium aurantiacum TaxID=33987 RepID=A0A377HIQ9_9BACL|nr:hypothetical protein [Exiguobacterium aurantiacum]STO53326.1 Uncharacterised protein [Exiguobacterium aurantiacum]
MAGLIPFNKKRNDLMNLGFNDFSNMLDDFFSASGLPFERSLRHDTFKVDIKDEADKYVIEAEVPGVKKKIFKLQSMMVVSTYLLSMKVFLKKKEVNISTENVECHKCLAVFC